MLTTKAYHIRGETEQGMIYFLYVCIILKLYMKCMYIFEDKTEKEEERKTPLTQSNINFFLYAHCD